MNIHTARHSFFYATLWCCFVSCQALPAQFTYQYPSEVAFNDQQGVELKPFVESFAKSINKELNQSIFFDTSFVVSPDKVREYHTKPKPVASEVGQLYDITTDDGLKLGATYFDRGSDSVIFIGEGFTNFREQMTPFVAMFPDYDVVLFDFRGHGYDEVHWYDPSTWQTNIIKKAFDIDNTKVRFGGVEELDVFAVVNGFTHLKKHQTGKSYKNIWGLGLCYGALVFAKAQALKPTLFDKLVLDGCWTSLELYIEKVKKDPATICNPQTGGWTNHWLFCRPWFQDFLDTLARDIVFDFPNFSLLEYIPKIKIPVLFFYGKNDYMVPRDEFENFWQHIGSGEKTAVITSNPHVRNHLKQKELYKLVAELFFELPQSELRDCLLHPEMLANHYVNKIRSFASAQILRDAATQLLRTSAN